jgi:hypothetical protein
LLLLLLLRSSLAPGPRGTLDGDVVRRVLPTQSPPRAHPCARFYAFPSPPERLGKNSATFLKEGKAMGSADLALRGIGVPTIF